MTPADFTVLTQAYCFVNFMSVSILLHVLEAPLGKQIKPPWIRLYLILSSTCNLHSHVLEISLDGSTCTFYCFLKRLCIIEGPGVVKFFT